MRKKRQNVTSVIRYQHSLAFSSYCRCIPKRTEYYAIECNKRLTGISVVKAINRYFSGESD